MDSRIAANRRLWNEWARINQESDFYDMAGFRAGQTSLKPIELAELGDVAGKSLLHLQCHFGQDTLSWARRGAKVTGIDLSSPMLENSAFEPVSVPCGLSDDETTKTIGKSEKTTITIPTMWRHPVARNQVQA